MSSFFAAGLSRLTLDGEFRDLLVPGSPPRNLSFLLNDVSLDVPGPEPDPLAHLRGREIGLRRLNLKGYPVSEGTLPADSLPARLALAVLGGDEASVWPLIDALLESRRRPAGG